MSYRTIHEVINNHVLLSTSANKNLVTDDAYHKHLNRLRNWLSAEYASELSRTIGDETAKERVKSLIRLYTHNNSLSVENESYELLIDKFYDDLAGFAFINKYLFDENVEEVNGNSWNDIEVVYADKWYKIDEAFSSPQHAADIVKKMMRVGGVTLDEKKPIGDSYISTGVRVSAMIPPIIDSSIGAVFSLRKQKSRVFSMSELTATQTCTEEEFKFLKICLNHGVSVGIAGATSSGKTTDIISLLSAVDNDKRIYVIEDTRETFITRRNPNGKVENRVVYTKTRPNLHQERNISAADLLRAAMRYHPDIIVPAEMRDEVAMVAVEAGRTGHTILAGLHANNAVEAYDRILTMCLMSGTRLSEGLLMRLIMSAFPIMVFKAQLPDKTRKVMQIYEALRFDPVNNTLVGNILFQYVIEGRKLCQDKTKIKEMLGYHKQVSKISKRLANRLMANGCEINLIKEYAPRDWYPGEEGFYL